MSRQVINRILLSLLLLLSQQMAFAHALSHWTGTLPGSTAQQHADEGSSLSSAVAQDQTCDHCLALAQLAAPLGSTARTFCAGDNGVTAFISTDSGSHCARVVCGFNPRAPPQA
ncbi:MAG TPA: hypothetical protein VGD30_15440 [Telluria sp.]